jgi:hypothetical protein
MYLSCIQLDLNRVTQLLSVETRNEVQTPLILFQDSTAQCTGYINGGFCKVLRGYFMMLREVYEKKTS